MSLCKRVMYKVFAQTHCHYKAKSRKYQGVFKVKSRVKTWQVRGILVSTLGALASPKMGDGTRYKPIIHKG